MQPEEKSHVIKALTPGEIAGSYDVSTRTLQTWLRPFAHRIGPRPSKYFTVLQVGLIYQLLGVPNSIINQKENF